MIYLYNDSEPFTAKWDGVEHILSHEPVKVEKGVAEHWMLRYPDAQLRIEEIESETIEPRSIVNPLESNDRGEAFAAIKRPGRPSRKAAGE